METKISSSSAIGQSKRCEFAWQTFTFYRFQANKQQHSHSQCVSSDVAFFPPFSLLVSSTNSKRLFCNTVLMAVFDLFFLLHFLANTKWDMRNDNRASGKVSFSPENNGLKRDLKLQQVDANTWSALFYSDYILSDRRTDTLVSQCLSWRWSSNISTSKKKRKFVDERNSTHNAQWD